MQTASSHIKIRPLRCYIGVLIFWLYSSALFAQTQIDLALKTYNQRTVPYISVEELSQKPLEYLILDTRKREEYEVSHIPNALWVGEKLDETAFAKAHTDTTKPIVVYCSIGIRSEKIGEQLQDLGYIHVYNLYGSIFDWKNKGQVVVNKEQRPTDSVHVYNKHWGKYLTKGIKVY